MKSKVNAVLVVLSCLLISLITPMIAQNPGGLISTDLVVFSRTGSCPTGWTEDTAVRGRVIVGKVSGGTSQATVGTALTDQENRPAGVHGHSGSTITMNAHSHTITDPGHSHTITDGGHTHTITDPNHSHGITDPGHSHTITDPGHNHQTYGDDAGGSHIGITQFGFSDTVVTGAPMIAAMTGITGVNGAVSNVTVNSGSTGITGANSNTTGITGANGAVSNVTVNNATDTGTITINNSSGTAGTNAPYIQYIACKHQ